MASGRDGAAGHKWCAGMGRSAHAYSEPGAVCVTGVRRATLEHRDACEVSVRRGLQARGAVRPEDLAEGVFLEHKALSRLPVTGGIR